MILHLLLDGVRQRVTLTAIPGDPYGFSVEGPEGQPLSVSACLLRPGLLSLIVNGRSVRCTLPPPPPGAEGEERVLTVGGQRHTYRMEDPRSLKGRRAQANAADGAVPIKASMPGRVVRLLVAQGEAIEAHAGVLVIEAMKMQNELKSPKAGTVSELRVGPGEAVASGQVLAIVE